MTKIFATLITILLFAEHSSANQDDWGKTTNQKAEFYTASDVPKSQIALTNAMVWNSFQNLGELRAAGILDSR